MFHVKHFGTIDAAGKEPRHVGLREAPVSGFLRRQAQTPRRFRLP
jgi:hypothetical protein